MTAKSLRTHFQKIKNQMDLVDFDVSQVEIRSSPYLRSIQTAGIIAKKLKVEKIKVDSLLVKPLTWTDKYNPIPHLVYTKLRRLGNGYDDLIFTYSEIFSEQTIIDDSEDIFLDNKKAEKPKSIMNVFPEESMEGAMTRTYLAYDLVLRKKNFVICVTHQENLEWITTINELMKEKIDQSGHRNFS